MAFTLTVHHDPGLLRVTCAGAASLGDLCGVVDLVATVATHHAHQRALVDLTAIEIDFSFTDHLALGSHAAARLSRLDRVASVVPARLRVGTSEKAARNMGLQLRTFDDLAEGLAWIAA